MRTGYPRTAYLKLLTKTKTMKATELRIGNYVYLEATRENEIVKAIDYTVYERCVIKTKGGDSEYLTGVEPIPLTEEWHNSFGVIINGFKSFEYPIGNNKLIVFNGDYIFLRQNDINKKRHEDDIVTLWNNDLKRRVIYVHEWQNLYFALTGKEITKL